MKALTQITASCHVARGILGKFGARPEWWCRMLRLPWPANSIVMISEIRLLLK
jgi:hypothetical protein